ncbi:MAG: peptidoglycan DD-metalloendopeptidase family protein [Chloroflexota bacterium]|nr:peptidoglycan DD-metalloendopeptidase family protein [Chloroflexota bacterium]
MKDFFDTRTFFYRKLSLLWFRICSEAKKQWAAGLSLVLVTAIIAIAASNGLKGLSQPTPNHKLGARVTSAPHIGAPTPFMHRPFYGNSTISSRTTSFVDHDKPWYENDGTFVRHDGAKWTNVAIGSCTGGVSCYDGHNGYDLNLRFEPVLSAAAGTVIRAGWYNAYDHQSSLGLWVAVDHGNGYVTAYGHLSAITVAYGDKIGIQWQVGTSGTTGSSTGPHLHMATYYLPYWSATDPFGWSGNYPDPNTVPDNYLWVNTPGTSYTVPNLSANGNAVYPGATLVDDGASGWSSSGNWATATSSTDIKGNLHYTATTSGSATATATATWQPRIPADGYYEVGAFVDDTHASSSWAPYTVYSADPNSAGREISHTVYVDESHIGSFQGPFGWENTGAQWISLGTYYFRASMSDRVLLKNATGESGAQLSADGMEFVPVSMATTITPSLPKAYYFAEGYTGSGTTEYLSLTNPSVNPARVSITYLYPSAAPQIRSYTVATQAHTVLNINNEVGSNQTISMIVQSDQPFSAERTMYTHKDAFTTATDSVGSASLSSNWYFAEGNTTYGWNTLLAVLNPSSLPVTGKIMYLLNNQAVTGKTYTFPARSRNTLVLNADFPNHQFGMSFTTSSPVLVEQLEYLTASNLRGGNAVVGAMSPQTNWYFGAGNTLPGFNEWLALANPLSKTATAQISYLTIDGNTISQTVTVPALSRIEVNVNSVVRPTPHATLITASSPIVAERHDYFITSLNGLVLGNTVLMGTSSLHTSWYLASGDTSSGHAQSLALANPNGIATQVQVVYYLFSAMPIVKTYTLNAKSRLTINLKDDVGDNVTTGVAVYATVLIVTEQQMFFNVGGNTGGYASMGFGN